MSTEYERQLANTLAESVFHTTGVPYRRRCAWCGIAGKIASYTALLAALAIVLRTAQGLLV